MTAFFRLEQLVMQFGGLTAVNNFSMTLEAGELMGLIGPNGAGKTTVFNMITGIHTPTAGRVVWRDENVTPLAPQQIAAKGIARTFQNIRLFTDMTVLENVLVSFHYDLRARFWEAMLGFPRYHREEARVQE